jgi:hypothetical protein
MKCKPADEKAVATSREEATSLGGKYNPEDDGRSDVNNEESRI